MTGSGEGARDEARPVRVVRTRWKGAVLVCGKCLKRHEDGKAVRRALKQAVKAHTKVGARKVKVVKTGCIGLCPRKAVVLASAATLGEGEVVLVRNEAEVAGAVPRLLP